jgi:hypothetical protein
LSSAKIFTDAVNAMKYVNSLSFIIMCLLSDNCVIYATLELIIGN